MSNNKNISNDITDLDKYPINRGVMDDNHIRCCFYVIIAVETVLSNVR